MPWLAAALALLPMAVTAQYFDLSPTVQLSEVPRFTVPFTIELRIHNAGPDQAVGVVVNHTVPPGLSVLSAEVHGCVVNAEGSYCYDPANPVSSSINGNVVQCQAGRIPAGRYRPIFIRVVSAVPGSYNTQTAIAGMPWELPGNNSITFPVAVHSHGLLVKGGGSAAEQSGGNVTFTVQLVPSNSVPVTVDYEAVGLTATAGEDFTAVSGSLTFPPGVTNQTVSVPVLDDNWQEPYSQSFTLRLTNAVNAEVDPNPQPGYVADNEPPLQLAINDAEPVPEGDGQAVNALFQIDLVGRADVPVLVDYTAGPPVSQSGTLEIPARATNHALSVSFSGNLTAETNRVFELTLSNPRGTPTILSQATAQGTILDDDEIPGKFHHLTMDPVPSPQIAGRSIPVTLRAYDFQNSPATNFAGTVSLGIYDFGGGQAHRFVDVSNFVAGAAVANVTYTNATTNAHLTGWLWMGSYYVTASGPGVKVIPPPRLFFSLPASGTEGEGVLVGAGRVSITNLDVQNVEVQLTSSDALEIQVPPTVIIPIGQTSAVFGVTIVDDDRLDATHGTSVSANAPGYIGAAGSVTVSDNESTALQISIPSGLNEAPGNPIVFGTLTVDRPVGVMVQVAMSSSDPTELTVQGNAYILPGETNGSFWVSQRDDALMDGPQTVTITAHVQNWIDGSAMAVVNDNDTNLTVSLNFVKQTAFEGVGTQTNALRVQLPGTNTSDVIVQLSSSDTNEAVVPDGLVIPAGQLFVQTNLIVVDDTKFDGNQLVTITASSPGLNSGIRTFTVYDNDPHHFVFNAIPGLQTSGVPFQVRFSARDVNDTIMNYFSGPIALAAVAAGKTLFSTPSFTTNYLGGRFGNLWSENLTINGWGTNVQIMAYMTNGASSLSNPFNVLAPASLSELRIGPVELGDNVVTLRFNTITGLNYQLEWSTNVTSPNWLPVGPAQIGTGQEMSVSEPVSTALEHRFYRLSVSP